MTLRAVPLRMYGEVSDVGALEWSWVEEQLRGSPTYWVVASGRGAPHPRPVWGVWEGDALFVSIGSPVVNGLLAADPTITAHLESGTDVIVVEGTARLATSGADAAIAAYDLKYDWRYDVDEYGALTRLEPSQVLAWRAAGWAGRDGFQAVGKWITDPGPTG